MRCLSLAFVPHEQGGAAKWVRIMVSAKQCGDTLRTDPVAPPFIACAVASLFAFLCAYTCVTHKVAALLKVQLSTPTSTGKHGDRESARVIGKGEWLRLSPCPSDHFDGDDDGLLKGPTKTNEESH